MFNPKVNSIKKSGKCVAVPPDYSEFGELRHKTGNPSRKSNLTVKKPGSSK